jgi:hypothetical protein
MPGATLSSVDEEPSPIRDIEPLDNDWAIVRVDTGSGETIEYEVMLGEPQESLRR